MRAVLAAMLALKASAKAGSVASIRARSRAAKARFVRVVQDEAKPCTAPRCARSPKGTTRVQ